MPVPSLKSASAHCSAGHRSLAGARGGRGKDTRVSPVRGTDSALAYAVVAPSLLGELLQGSSDDVIAAGH